MWNKNMLMALFIHIAVLLLISCDRTSLPLCNAFVSKFPKATLLAQHHRSRVGTADTARATSISSTKIATRRGTSIIKMDKRGLFLSSDGNNVEGEKKTSALPTLLDPGTKGGVVVLATLLFIAPFILYNALTSTGTLSEEDAGRYIGVGFTVVTSLLWVSTYIFRVATKDMTYAKQLIDYENAVIKKRLEELEEDEVQAMLEDIEREQLEEQEAF